MNLKTSLRTLSLALLLAAPALASALSLADGALFIGGYGSWSYQITNGDRFLLGDSDGDWDTADFDLAMIAKPADQLRINALLHFKGEASEMEWGFVDYTFSDALHVRAGKVKAPIGNYQEIAEVGTIRPFQDLATAVYGPAGIGATAYQGLGFTGAFQLPSEFSLEYDLWGGAVFIDAYEPFDAFNGEVTYPITGGAPFVPGVEELRVENIVGARLSLVTPWAWTFRLSGYGGSATLDSEGDDSVTLGSGGASAWYRGEKLWVSIEGFYSAKGDLEKTTAAYVEAAWHFTPEIQAAAKFEYARTDVKDLEKAADRLEKHDELSLGLNYWFTPSFVVRASADYVYGSRFIESEDWEGFDFTTKPPLPDEDVVRFVLGTQFSF